MKAVLNGLCQLVSGGGVASDVTIIGDDVGLAKDATLQTLLGDVQTSDGAAAPANGIQIGGKDGVGNYHVLQVETDGSLVVSVPSLPLPTGAATLAEQQTQTVWLTSIDGLLATINTNTFDTAFYTNILQAGTALEDAASASGSRGFVSLTQRQDTIASSTDTDGDYQFLKTSSLGGLYVTGLQADDAAINSANNPFIVGGQAYSSLRSVVSANDVVRSAHDLQGRQVVAPFTMAYTDFYDAPGVSTSERTLVAAPGAGQSIYLTSFTQTNEDATARAVVLRKGSGGSIFETLIQAPVSSFTHSYPTPKKIGDNLALTAQKSNAAVQYWSGTYFIAAS